MHTLADAVIHALVYISIAPNDVDRADDDVQVVEALAVTLRSCSQDERTALRAALERARGKLVSSSELQNVFRAIESDIINAEPS